MSGEDRRSLAACVAELTGVAAAEVPAAGERELREWLATRGLGLVPVADPDAFEWPGRFLGRRRGGGWVVMFGVPPGVVLDPSGGPTGGPAGLEAAFVLAPHEPAGGRAGFAAAPATGVVELIAVAPAREAPMQVVAEARAIAGRGLDGDRYAAGEGTFSDPGGTGHDLTLVEAEALEELAAADAEIAPEQARRNLVVRGIALDALIGREFRVGEVSCFGRRRCEPCAHLERLTRSGVLRGLVHRGGLRADVLSAGAIHVGDRISAAGISPSTTAG